MQSIIWIVKEYAQLLEWNGESEIMVEQLHEIVTSKAPKPAFTPPSSIHFQEGK
jgi:hypothetical protein